MATPLEFDLPCSVVLCGSKSLPDKWEEYQFAHVDGRTISFLVPEGAGFSEAQNMGEFLRIWAED